MRQEHEESCSGGLHTHWMPRKGHGPNLMTRPVEPMLPVSFLFVG